MSFGLYGSEDIDYNATADALVDYIIARTEEINVRLEGIGLRLNAVSWYMPQRYNFETDDITLDIECVERASYLSYLEIAREGIQALLDKNKSYDGYMSLTVKYVDEEIDNIQHDKSPDILPIRYAMRGFMTQEDVLDSLIFIPEE